ncbi:TPA: hypothetical protein ENS27_00980 [bacterium]|nr:hypothetical protein [bacterium]
MKCKETEGESVHHSLTFPAFLCYNRLIFTNSNSYKLQMSIQNKIFEVLQMKHVFIPAIILIIISFFLFSCEEGEFNEDELNKSGNYIIFDRSIKWSPDSKMIALIQNNSLVVKDVITGNTRALTGTGYYDDPSWSPDSQKIVYMSASRDLKADLWIKSADGKDIAKIFVSSLAADSHPRWSPDGKWILFHSYRDRDIAIWIKNSEFTGEQEMKITNDSAIDQNAEWSPDGKKFAFESKRTGNFDIWIAELNNPSNLKQITNESSADTLPLWSPDGTKIAFKSDRFGIYGIWVKNADGSGDTIHISQGFDDGDDHDWSPDNKYIAFVANGTVYVRNSDGTGDPIEIGKGLEPKWSPDGTKMAYVAFESNKYTMKIIDLPENLK